MAGVRGDFAKLQRLVGTFRMLKAQGARRVTKQMSLEALDLVHSCFDNERSPDGVPWIRSQRAARDGGKTLQDTRRLKNSIASRVTSSTSFSLVTKVIYAAIHNFGGEIRRKERLQRRTRKGTFSRRGRLSSWMGAVAAVMPQRQFIPDSGRMPPAWERRLRAVADTTVMAIFR